MDNVNSTKKLFDEICSFPEAYSKKKYAISVKEFEAKKVVRDLKAFGKKIFNELDEDITEGFTILCSHGMTFMPHIVWVAFLPTGKKVSRHMSVAICFGKYGEGAVCGLMESRGIKQCITETVNRTKQKEIRVNINGGKVKNDYTNNFVNPLEILRGELDPDKAIKHLGDSIILLKGLLENKSALRR